MTRIRPETRNRARALRAEMTPEERMVWAKLREVNRMVGTNFRRQAPIGPFIADFVDFGRKLVVEVDGGQHSGPGDEARDAWMRGEGFQVLRFWNSDVREHLEGVMERVLDVLELTFDAPPPRPSPTRGEGGVRMSPRARPASGEHK